jgi:hypothetical protein
VTLPGHRRVLLSAAVMLLTACGGSDSPTGSDDPPPTPTVASVTMLTTPGDQTVGSVVTVEARVDNTLGQPMAGTAVTFAASAGSVSPATTTTNSLGIASASWTLGTAAGTQTLTATASGRSAALSVAARAGAAAAFAVVSGNQQTGTVAQTLTAPLVVSVKDSFGNPKAGEAITVAITAGGGSVASPSVTTGSDGQASIAWTLGTAPGTNTLTATHALGAVSFAATAQAGAASVLQKVAGDNQSATIGTPVATAPRVRVTDAQGNPLGGISVVFAVTAGGGTVTGGSATTAADGTASVGSWTLGPAPGANTLSATSAGLASVAFTATARAGAPAALVKVAGDNQSATVGTAVAAAPTVRVTDAQGNALGGVAVVFAVTAGGGAATGTTATTATDGTASVGSWTLGSTPGANTLTATVAGVTPATFTATAVVGAPAVVLKVAGDNQSAPVGTAVPVDPRVRVTDSKGNALSGVSVTFAVAAGGGSVVGATSSTIADGTASVGAWTLGATPGANALTATVTGLSPVTFTATGTASGASGFNIDLRFIGSMPADIQGAFTTAKARWEQVITGDLSNVQITSAAGECTDNQPAINEIIDDVLIFAEVAAIDGEGNTLGQAGPCYTRNSDGLPIIGTMTFDVADLELMKTEGTLQDVILHEMGHVLGIGTLWENQSLLQGKGTDDPFYSGANGVAGYQGMGGIVTNGVPVENTGEEGTRDGHWRETRFQNELMTGYISGANNPLSILTVRALVDHGFVVNDAAADAFTLPAPASPGAAPVSEPARKHWEILLKPIAQVGANGAVQRIR